METEQIMAELLILREQNAELIRTIKEMETDMKLLKKDSYSEVKKQEQLEQYRWWVAASEF